jgi:uncharacterized delta-60 repeat protein
MALDKRGGMVRLIGAIALCICGLSMAGPAQVSAAPGDIDSSFGKEGAVEQTEPLGSYSTFLPQSEDMAVGPEDRIFVLQGSRNCRERTCRIGFFIRRSLPDGELDSSFGAGGVSARVTVTAPSSPYTYAWGEPFGSLAVDSAGRAVVAAADGGDVTLFRFDAAGRLDREFGGDGVITTDFGGGESGARIDVLDDGRIVLASGSWRESEGRSFVILARYEANGALDPSFGAGTPELQGAGWMAIPGFTPGGIQLSASGGITLAGPGCCGGEKRQVAYVGRRGPDGQLLAPFAPASPWKYIKVGKYARVSSVIALPRGRTYVVGHSNRGVFAARILPSGRPDPAFRGDGVVWFREMTVGRTAAVVDQGGHLYVGLHSGDREEFDPGEALLARLLWSGRADRSWGDDPPGYAKLPARFNDVLALAFQSSGKLVVLGASAGYCVRSCIPPRGILTRLFADPPPRCFGKKVTIVGTAESDRLVGTGHRDVIAARGGDDVVFGRAGNDLICGGGGRDELRGGRGRDRVRQ